MTLKTEKSSETRLVKVEGRPNLPEQPKERTRWESFKFFLFPHLKRSKELAEAYAEARVEKEKSEARKTNEEAAEIAARKDLTRQKEVKQFSSIIDDIFADNGLSPVAKALKLAKLMEKNPQVEAQLDKVKDIIKQLSLKKGLNVEVEDDSLKFLPEEQDLDTGQREADRELEDAMTDKDRMVEALMRSNMPIRELGLSMRARTCLESVKVETLGHLLHMTDADLLKIRGFGRSSLREVKRKLADMGLSLGMLGKK